MAVVGAAAYVAGSYLGVFALLSIVGLDDFSGWQFEVTVVPAGSLIAALAVASVSPDRSRATTPTLVAAAVAATLSSAYLHLTNGDFGTAMIIGGLFAVGVSVTTAVIASNR